MDPPARPRQFALAIVVRTLLIALGSSLLAALVFVAAVFFSESPQFWTSLVLASICFLVMRRSRRNWVRMFWWNSGAVFALWALFDIGARFWMGHGIGAVLPRVVLSTGLPQFSPRVLKLEDPILGMRLAPGAQEHFGDAVYNINGDGLRVGPTPVPGVQPQGCVLFFGCSYTFGTGVNDDQTFPYLVQVKTHGRFLSRNFGVEGSAPHYALAQVESGFVERAAHCAPTHAIYLVLPHHLLRVGGKFAVRFGPKYVLQPNGALVRDGSLARSTSEWFWDMLRYTSALYVAAYGYSGAPVDDGDVQLVTALLRTLHERLLDRYPGIHFDILYWDDETTGPTLQLGQQLRTIGVPVHNLSTVLPIQQKARNVYLPDDHHPNTWAYEQIAEYVDRDVLGITPR